MPGDASLWLAGALAAAGIGLLRLAWGRRSRVVALNAGGWGLLAGALVLGALGAGAWGVTVAALVAMTAASVLLAAAAFEPPRWARKPSQRTPGGLLAVDRTGAGKRVATFLVAGPLALAAGLALSLGIRGLMIGAGASETDGNAAVLFLLPLVWTLLALALMMNDSRRRQMRWLLGLAAAGAAMILVTRGAG